MATRRGSAALGCRRTLVPPQGVAVAGTLWLRAVDRRPEQVRTAVAPPREAEGGPLEGGVDWAPRVLEEGLTS